MVAGPRRGGRRVRARAGCP